MIFQTPQWIPVMLVPEGNGKTNKIPVNHLTLMPDNALDSANWTTHEQARAAAALLGPIGTVGFVLTEQDDFFCVDIDNARNGDTWSPLVYEVINDLPGCMVEVSQSGNGIHIWGRFPNPPPHRKKRIDLGMECYTEKRFIALGTNQNGTIAPRCDKFPEFLAKHFPPIETAQAGVAEEGPCAEWRGPTDDNELLRRALNSKSAGAVFGNKATFADLWTCNVDVLSRAYPPDGASTEQYDASSADMALAQHLAFWTGRDVARIERLMRRSALVREKWDTRSDYLVDRTIRTACSRQAQVLQDKPVEPAPSPASVSAPAPGLGPANPAGETPQPRRVEGSTFLSVEQQIELFKGCVYIRDHHRALMPGGHLLKPDQFRAQFGGYTFVMTDDGSKVTRNAWEAFTESQVLRSPRADGVTFKPQMKPAALVHTPGRVLANTYWPVQVPRKKGDATPFFNHLAKLLPDEEERRIYFYYLCALVQRQGFKFQWAPVLQGVEGNGKSLFSRCVAHAIGDRYVHWPRADKLASGFNAWLIGTTFIAVEEIKTEHREDLTEILKVLITGDDGQEIEKKGVDQFSAEICANFLFTTNHKNALRKTLNDRRFWVLFTPQQTFDDLARDGITPEYMNDLYHWLKHEDGYAIVADLLWTTPIPPEYDPSIGLQRAPVTKSTHLAVAESLGPVEQEIVEAIEREELGFRGGWVSSGALDSLLRRIGKERVVPQNKRRAMMEGLGYVWHPALMEGRVNNPVLPDGAKVRLYVKKDRAGLLALRGGAEVATAYSSAQGCAA